MKLYVIVEQNVKVIKIVRSSSCLSRDLNPVHVSFDFVCFDSVYDQREHEWGDSENAIVRQKFPKCSLSALSNTFSWCTNLMCGEEFHLMNCPIIIRSVAIWFTWSVLPETCLLFSQILVCRSLDTFKDHFMCDLSWNRQDDSTVVENLGKCLPSMKT